MSDDPYTMSAKLCDDDGIVRGGSRHDGRDYPCTGHAHFAGEHLYCTSPAHPRNATIPSVDELPADLRRVLEDPGVTIARDGLVWALLGRAAVGEPSDGR
jgi:hypothetical protein